MDVLKIAKSKTRKKILQLFFFDPTKRYYLREIERLLKITAGNIRRELLSLERAGLFKKEKIGKQVYYFLNKKSPIFEEFKSIVSKTIGIEAVLKEKLAGIAGIKVAFIYGSIARNKEDALSDIDIFIIGSINEDDLLKAISKAEKRLSREINYVIFSQSDLIDGLSTNIAFLKDVISSERIFLIGDNNDLEKVISRGKNP